MEIGQKTILNDEKYLRQISKEVDFSDNKYKDDLVVLEKFCSDNDCFALAAIQVGIPKRIIYLKNTTLDIPIDETNHNEGKILINPIIKSSKGHTKFWEACLSCMDNTGLVSRPYEIELEYFDNHGDRQTKIFRGFETTVLSHELDHLDGILHMDIAEEILQLSAEKRKKFREQNPYEILSKTCIIKNKKKND